MDHQTSQNQTISQEKKDEHLIVRKVNQQTLTLTEVKEQLDKPLSSLPEIFSIINNYIPSDRRLYLNLRMSNLRRLDFIKEKINFYGSPDRMAKLSVLRGTSRFLLGNPGMENKQFPDIFIPIGYSDEIITFGEMLDQIKSFLSQTVPDEILWERAPGEFHWEVSPEGPVWVLDQKSSREEKTKNFERLKKSHLSYYKLMGVISLSGTFNYSKDSGGFYYGKWENGGFYMDGTLYNGGEYGYW